jgi:hypothetical protein
LRTVVGRHADETDKLVTESFDALDFHEPDTSNLGMGNQSYRLTLTEM